MAEPRRLKVRDSQTGEINEITWSEERNPTRDEVRSIVEAQKKQTPPTPTPSPVSTPAPVDVPETPEEDSLLDDAKQGWEWLTTPFEPVVTGARKIGEAIAGPEEGPGIFRQAVSAAASPFTALPAMAGAAIDGNIDLSDPEGSLRNIEAAKRGAIIGGAEGAGSIPTPLDVATLGTSALTRRGAGTLAKAVNHVANIGEVAYGGSKMYEGAVEGDLGEFGGGAFRAALGTIGELPRSNRPSVPKAAADVLDDPIDVTDSVEVLDDIVQPVNASKVPADPNVADIVRPGRAQRRNLPTLDFYDWVNWKTASDLQKQAASRRWKQYASPGFSDLTKVNRQGDPKVDGMLHQWKTQLTDSGVNMGQTGRWLTGLFEGKPSDIRKALKDYSATTGYVFERTLEGVLRDYERALASGLQPKHGNLRDALSHLESKFARADANARFKTYLHKGEVDPATGKRTPYIMPEGKIPPEEKHLWEALPHGFREVDSVKGRKGQGGSTSYFSRGEMARKLKNHYGQADPTNEALAVPSRIAKEMSLASSMLPGTAQSLHGNALAVQHALAQPSILKAGKELAKSVPAILDPDVNIRYLDENMDKAVEWAKDGLTMSAEQHAFTEAAERATGSYPARIGARWRKAGRGLQTAAGEAYRGLKGQPTDLGGHLSRATKLITEPHKALFDEPLFQAYLPAKKLQLAESTFAEAVKSIPDNLKPKEREAAIRNLRKQVAISVNDVMSGINHPAQGRSKNKQALLQAALIAPDWAESQLVRMPKEIARALTTKRKDPGWKIYRNSAKNLVISVAAMNIAQKLMSGDFSLENQPGQKSNIHLGDITDPKGVVRERHGRPFSTAAWHRVPFDIGAGVVDGDIGEVVKPLISRLSAPAHLITTLIKNQDWKKRPIYGKGAKGNQIANITRELFNAYGPSYARSFYKAVTGDSSFEQAIVEGAELPFTYPSKKDERGRTVKVN